MMVSDLGKCAREQQQLLGSWKVKLGAQDWGARMFSRVDSTVMPLLHSVGNALAKCKM